MMVLKPVALPVSRSKVHAKLLEENKRAQILKILQNVKSPKRLPKEVRNLNQQSYSRPSFSSPSPERRTAHSASTSRAQSPTIVPVFATLSQTLRWDPYVKTTIIPDVAGFKVPPHQEKLPDDSNTPLNSNVSSNEEPSPPYKFQVAVRDEPVRTVKNNIVEFNNQSTMTIEQSSVGCGSSISSSEPRFSDMILPSSVLPENDTQQDDVHAFHYPTQEPGEQHLLYRTGSYLKPVMMKPSHHQYYRPTSCVRPMQNRVISDITNTQRIQCECVISKNCIREEKKVLYNEGIFDFQSYRPKHRTVRTPPSTPMRIGSRNKLSTKSYIPFSHYNDSKYHNCCVKPTSRSVTKGYQVCPGKEIAWPKRLLASEQDIDAFLYSEPSIYLARKKPEQWTMCPHKFPGEL